MSAPDFQGHPPSKEQEQMGQETAAYWRGVINAASVQALARIEEAAKQLIGLTSILQGLFFAIYAFSDVRKQITGIHVLEFVLLIWLIFFLPIILWFISLLCAAQVFIPKVRSDTDLDDRGEQAWRRLRDAYEKVVTEKLQWLRRSHLALIFSFGAVLLVLVTIVILPAPPTSGPIPIFIVTPTPGIVPTSTP